MGKLFKNVEKYLIDVDKTSIFVEIGSCNYEGSTEYFAELANKRSTKFISVDINPKISVRYKHSGDYSTEIVNAITFDIGIGSIWAKNKFPEYNKLIGCLYLDNYDYNWDVDNIHPMYTEIKSDEKYKNLGIEINNLDCQVEHLSQMILLMQYMTKISVIVCDDTYKINDCYIGKCGAVIPYLILNGYKIMEESRNDGIILKRE